MSHGTDSRGAFLDMFKIQTDNTKVEISNILQKLDISSQGFSSYGIEPEFSQNVEELPDINSNDYVKETTEGFEVWDGMRWVQLSQQANIKIESFQDPHNDNQPAVRVWARDAKTNTSVVFVDNDIAAPGWDLGYTYTGDNFDPVAELSALQRGGYYEDPFYNITKNSIGIGGSVAGALEIRHVGNMTPWCTGNAIRNADGWYRNAEGLYENLSKQRGIGGGGYQKSAQRALGKAKVFKGAGRILLGVSVALSGYEGINAYMTNDSNRREVAFKATVDVTIALIGTFGGPAGWVIAGTYFILDVSGAFGDWGQLSGISQGDYNNYLMQKIQYEHGSHISSLKFEVNYVAPLEQQQREMYLEERTMTRDNIRISIPKILFKN